MDENIAKEFYSRADIQERILHFSKNREIGVMFDGYFGKRPDVIENYFDIKTLVNKGVRSFHSSEERWLNPLMLGGEKKPQDRDGNRLGWDLILDLDGVSFEYSQIVGKLLVDYFTSIEVHNVSVKFSGNKGFHLAIPFEAFSKFNGLNETRLLFPDVAKKMAMYLMYHLRGKISKTILDKEGGIENISKMYDIPMDELVNKDEGSYFFDFMKVIEIDTILITSRHLFRMPYSFNEKSGLVSIPIHKDRVMEFTKDEAKPENVDPSKYIEFEFLYYDPKYGKDGDVLLHIIEQPDDDSFTGESGTYIDSGDLEEKISLIQNRKRESMGKMILASGGEVFEIDGTVEMKDFPETIKFALAHSFLDGKKRGLFLLLTYLTSINWTYDQIEDVIKTWNSAQEEPLKPNYVKAQITWFKAQPGKISPPKFNNDNYFRHIGITDEVIQKDRIAFKNVTIRTPLHHSFTFLKTKDAKKGKKKSNNKTDIKETNKVKKENSAKEIEKKPEDKV
jgi:hypothetical protein